MRIIAVFALTLYLLPTSGFCQYDNKIDSLGKLVKDYEVKNEKLSRDLVMSNEDMKKDLARANEKLQDYNDMYERQWNLFALWTSVFGIFIALAAGISISQFIVRMNKQGRKIQLVDTNLKDLDNKYRNLEAKHQDFNSSITQRIHEIHNYIEFIPYPFLGFQKIKITSEAILSTYMAFKANPTNTTLLTALHTSIGKTYNAIAMLENLVLAIYFKGEGASFTGKEYGVQDLLSTLEKIMDNEEGQTKEFAFQAFSTLNDAVNRLKIETTKKSTT